jgi:hypothetical protein
MVRGRARGAGSQESGYKFDCQYCEQVDVVQGPQPQLIFLLERERGHTISTPFQACVECAEEIKELNEAHNKKYAPVIKQVRPLREGSEMPVEIQQALQPSATDGKLDKLIAVVDSLAQLMTLQLQRDLGVEPARAPYIPAKSEALAEADKTAPVRRAAALKAFRAMKKPIKVIVEEPIASSPKKSEKRIAKAKAKPKPRRK